MSGAFDGVLRAAYPQVVAATVRRFGEIDLAEDAAQEAMVKALREWPKSGLPVEPVAWLITVARNAGIDAVRRRQRVQSLIDAGAVPDGADDALGEVGAAGPLEDDLLRLIYICCHPANTPETQVLLTLKVVLGFSVSDIAEALLAAPKAVERRVTRAKQRVRACVSEFAVPPKEALAERSGAVLKVAYLMFNHGYTRHSQPDVRRLRLMDQAIRLMQRTVRLFRDNPEAKSLLALMLLISARAPARLSGEGSFVPLSEQDRSRWDWPRIREGRAVLEAVFAARHPPNAYQIQAAIASLHNVAERQDTDWPQIVALYDKLAAYDPSPVVPVNRAVARAFSGDELGALRDLRALAREPRLQSFQPYHAACGYVFGRVGHLSEARTAYRRAIELCEARAERRHLEACLAALC